MKAPIFLLTLATITVIAIAAYPNLPSSAAIGRSGVPLTANGGSPKVFHTRLFHAMPSCIDPSPGYAQECAIMEQKILASTVRLVFHRWVENKDGHTYTFIKGASAHATVKAGGYLVTHNHLNIMRTDQKEGERITASVFDASDQPILLGASLKAIQIAVEEPETLVLDLGNCLDRDLEDMLEMSSAEFKDWKSLPLQPAMEVAQVNWDGTKTYVDWVVIQDVIKNNGTPRLELANVAGTGASGGGVFWNGHHIANTWSQITVFDGTNGSVARQYSVAALDSSQVAAPLGSSE